MSPAHGEEARQRRGDLPCLVLAQFAAGGSRKVWWYLFSKLGHCVAA